MTTNKPTKPCEDAIYDVYLKAAGKDHFSKRYISLAAASRHCQLLHDKYRRYGYRAHIKTILPAATGKHAPNKSSPFPRGA